MAQSHQNNYHTAGLRITVTGEINTIGNKHNTSKRLSPVNVRVLLSLLARAGEVVSRQQLFDLVWPNQVISDDALTRSISDLRAQLKNISNEELLIETIPKLGYRWVPEVNQKQQQTIKPHWQAHLKPVAIALLLLWLLTWGVMGLFHGWSKPTITPLVILPTEFIQAEPNDIQSDVAGILKKQTLEHPELQFLSQYAVESHSGSPFPYFSHEFGVRWFIESHVMLENNQPGLILSLIDARTALVTYSESHSVNSPSEIQQHCQKFILFVAGLSQPN